MTSILKSKIWPTVIGIASLTVAGVCAAQSAPPRVQSDQSGNGGIGLSVIYLPDNKGLTRDLSGAFKSDGATQPSLVCVATSPQFDAAANMGAVFQRLVANRASKIVGANITSPRECAAGFTDPIAIISDDLLASYAGGKALTTLEHLSVPQLRQIALNASQHPETLDTPQETLIKSLPAANQQDLAVIYGKGTGSCTDVDPVVAGKIAANLAPFTHMGPSDAFDALKGGNCGTFVGSVASARTIIAGLQRDQISFDMYSQLIPSAQVSAAGNQATTDAATSLLTDWTSHMDDGLKAITDTQYAALCKGNSKCAQSSSGGNSDTGSAPSSTPPFREVIGGLFMLIALAGLVSTIVFVVAHNRAKKQGNDALKNRNAAIAAFSFLGFLVAGAIGGWINPELSQPSSRTRASKPSIQENSSSTANQRLDEDVKCRTEAANKRDLCNNLASTPAQSAQCNFDYNQEKGYCPYGN